MHYLQQFYWLVPEACSSVRSTSSSIVTTLWLLEVPDTSLLGSATLLGMTTETIRDFVLFLLTPALPLWFELTKVLERYYLVGE